MRKGVLVSGIAVVVIGAILAGVAYLDLSNSNTIPSSSAGTVSGLTFTPPLVGSGSASLAWSGGSSQFRFAVYTCTDASCGKFQSTQPLAEGAGPSGTVSFAVNGGTTYAIVATAGGTNAVPVTVTLSGLTFLLLISLIVLAIGALVAFLGFRMKPKLRPAAATEEEPVKEMFVTKPFSGVQDPAAASSAPARAAYRPDSPEPTGPVYFEPTPSDAPKAGKPSAAPSGGSRAPIPCPHCGTLNDFWLTNCRNCRRPLSSTG